MPAYLIVNYKVENPDLYGQYSAAAGPALEIGSKCKLLVFDPATRELVLWLMDGAGAHSYESLGTVTPDWLPVGFNTDDAAIR